MAQAATDDYNERIRQRLAESGIYDRIFGRQPRFRYFEHNGWWFCWTTERMPDGKFAAFIYKPEGDALVKVQEKRFAKRMTAKAKASSWHTTTQEQASGRPPARILK